MALPKYLIIDPLFAFAAISMFDRPAEVLPTGTANDVPRVARKGM